MDRMKAKNLRRERRRIGIRKRVEGTPSRPRLSVYKSLKHIHAQIIDDLAGSTLVAVSTTEKGLGLTKGENVAAAVAAGQALAQRAVAKGIKEVVFDRNGFRFHGRVKALADAARKAGLQF
jgi:large subunit ribosomal protein L18